MSAETKKTPGTGTPPLAIKQTTPSQPPMLESVPMQPGAPQGTATGLPPHDLATEADLWTGRTHWKHFAGLILRALALSTGVAVALWQAVSRGIIAQAGAAWWIFLGVTAMTLLYLALRIGLTMLNERYRLTSQRLFIERGVLSQTVDQLELVRVDDVRISKTLLGRIFGTGTITVMTTDATDRHIELIGVRHPEDIAEVVRTHVRASRQKSLYVENI